MSTLQYSDFFGLIISSILSLWKMLFFVGGTTTWRKQLHLIILSPTQWNQNCTNIANVNNSRHKEFENLNVFLWKMVTWIQKTSFLTKHFIAHFKKKGSKCKKIFEIHKRKMKIHTNITKSKNIFQNPWISNDNLILEIFKITYFLNFQINFVDFKIYFWIFKLIWWIWNIFVDFQNSFSDLKNIWIIDPLGFVRTFSAHVYHSSSAFLPPCIRYLIATLTAGLKEICNMADEAVENTCFSLILCISILTVIDADFHAGKSGLWFKG